MGRYTDKDLDDYSDVEVQNYKAYEVRMQEFQPLKELTEKTMSYIKDEATKVIERKFLIICIISSMLSLQDRDC